jgi:hypothetical protein
MNKHFTKENTPRAKKYMTMFTSLATREIQTCCTAIRVTETKYWRPPNADTHIYMDLQRITLSEKEATPGYIPFLRWQDYRNEEHIGVCQRLRVKVDRWKEIGVGYKKGNMKACGLPSSPLSLVWRVETTSSDPSLIHVYPLSQDLCCDSQRQYLTSFVLNDLWYLPWSDRDQQIL